MVSTWSQASSSIEQDVSRAYQQMLREAGVTTFPGSPPPEIRGQLPLESPQESPQESPPKNVPE